jgi:hypothetical protein
MQLGHPESTLDDLPDFTRRFAAAKHGRYIEGGTFWPRGISSQVQIFVKGIFQGLNTVFSLSLKVI